MGNHLGFNPCPCNWQINWPNLLRTMNVSLNFVQEVGKDNGVEKMVKDEMETNLEVIVNSVEIVVVTEIIGIIAMEVETNSEIVTTSLVIEIAVIENMATNSMTRKVSMTESHVKLFQPEIASSCLRIFDPILLSCVVELVMHPIHHHHQHSKKEVPFCSFQLSVLQSICQSLEEDMVSTVLQIRLPNRKVLFDSFVKRKLRLPKLHLSLISMEFSYLFNDNNNKMSYVPKK